MSATNSDSRYLVAESVASPTSSCVPFIDGDDVNGRYIRVAPSRTIDLSCGDFAYKPPGLYVGPKILIRQAGVGLSAVLDETQSRCPQSLYVHRLKPHIAKMGYSHEYVLAALLSRTMAYVAFKKFAEVDAARAFAKVTLARLHALPIPSINFGNARHRRLHDEIRRHVRQLLNQEEAIGGRADLEIEQALRELWGLSPNDGAIINQELAKLPASRALLDLAPLPNNLAMGSSGSIED